MKVGSLFSGIGGLDLGLERAGMEVRWQVENDSYCCEVLSKHWPNVKRYGDITTIDWRTVEPVDLLCGGFPCQPVSVAGRRKGQEDKRWLWPEFAIAIRYLKPRWVLVENVPGLRSTNGGQAFAEVLSDLARYGYNAEWAGIPAAAVGAPHLRYRIFIVSYADATRLERDGDRGSISPSFSVSHTTTERNGADVADADGPIARRLSWRKKQTHAQSTISSQNMEIATGTRWNGKGAVFPTASGGTGPLGIFTRSNWWAVEPDVGRVATGVPARVDRLRALGNAVVPQVAEWVGKAILNAASR